jgi:hypothetical protein
MLSSLVHMCERVGNPIAKVLVDVRSVLACVWTRVIFFVSEQLNERTPYQNQLQQCLSLSLSLSLSLTRAWATTSGVRGVGNHHE